MFDLDDLSNYRSSNYMSSTVRLKNPNNVIIGNLNIKSVSGKFDQLKCLISNHVDILVLPETKQDETFTVPSFRLDGFSSTFRLDQNGKMTAY